jgi:hypothetical protein
MEERERERAGMRAGWAGAATQCGREEERAGSYGLKGEGGREGSRGAFPIFISFSFSQISYTKVLNDFEFKFENVVCQVYHHMFNKSSKQCHTCSFIPKLIYLY